METTHDWGVLDIEGVREVVDQAARKVARQYELEVEDLIQEASVLVCDLSTNLPECAYGENGLHLGTLQYRLEQDLVNLTETEVRKRDQQVSYEERYDEPVGEDTRRRTPVSIAVREAVSGYTRDLVESLLPAVWDESFCYGMKVENAPDGDMPRGATNKATGNTLAAHIADIKVGWAKAPLTLDERRALFLVAGLDWTQDEASTGHGEPRRIGYGFSLGVPQRTISDRVYSGIGKIVAQLNGDGALMTYLVTGEVAA